MSWTHKSTSKRVEIFKRRAWNLRARMLVFVQQMLFYATAEVLEPQWQKFMAKVNVLETDTPPSSSHNPNKTQQQNAFGAATTTNAPFTSTRQTVDELMQTHLDMLDSCMKDLGLTQSKLLRIHGKMVQSCTMFSQYTANLTRTLYSADPDFSALASSTSTAPSKRNKILASYSQHVNTGSSVAGAASATTAATAATTTSMVPEHDEARLARIEDTLARYEDFFNRHLRILIDTLNYYAATETVTLLGLCARLTNAEVQQRRDDLGSASATGAGASSAGMGGG